MSLIPYALARPALFALDPEHAHELTLANLERFQRTPLECTWAQTRVADPVTLAGLRFPNRVGLAAGLDKNGRAIDGLGAMGFGFIEVGTVTPKGQAGNPKPRMFRLPEHQALINRLGFNNEGLESFLANVQRSTRFRAQGGILGLNIGKNAATAIEDAASDYLKGLEGVYPHADYVTVNISSPNTANLRSLQSDAALKALLDVLMAKREELARRLGRKVPLFVKIAPDLEDSQVQVIAKTLQDCGVDGVIATNTTLAREAVQGHRHAAETGGRAGGQQPRHRPVACGAGGGLSHHWRGRGAERGGCAEQACRRRRSGADLHRPDLQRLGLGARGRTGPAPLRVRPGARVLQTVSP